MTDTCQGCIYDTEVCNHPERRKNPARFFANPSTKVCHTTEETEVCATVGSGEDGEWEGAGVNKETRSVCGNCAYIGEHGWGLPHDEKKCGKLAERQADFDARATHMEPVDQFRLRPTDGVLPHRSAERCRHYAARSKPHD